MFRIWTYRVAPFTSQIQLVSWPLSVCIYQHFSERETKKKKDLRGRYMVGVLSKKIVGLMCQEKR